MFKTGMAPLPLKWDDDRSGADLHADPAYWKQLNAWANSLCSSSTSSSSSSSAHEVNEASSVRVGHKRWRKGILVRPREEAEKAEKKRKEKEEKAEKKRKDKEVMAGAVAKALVAARATRVAVLAGAAVEATPAETK